ncbi:hypothetical protein [Namhaeicola litoreus]|uniref:DUF3995 domain-containing protein n=1 Tax=Namhaeicola litoreus TaxID=1052145 RepID=A0ABW3Y6H0_9FLAO
MVKFFFAWFPMIIVAIVNGLSREKVIANSLNELQAHQLSTMSLIILFGIYVWFLFKIWSPETQKQTFKIGILWLVLTILFEFLFGHFVAGHSWRKLFGDYHIFQGRLWVLFLLWIVICPYVIFRIQKQL